MKTVFCGDISPTSDNENLFAQVATDALFADTKTIFQAADVSVINLECALTESEKPIAKIGPPLKAPFATAKVLQELGVTHCALANNHVFDYGIQGAVDTMAALGAEGIGYTGIGNNRQDSLQDLIIEMDGKKLCVIAVCEHEYSYALDNRMGCREFDAFETPLQVRDAKEKYDRVVVLYHGGKEQCQYPSPRLRKACHAMAKSGADMILCQHSHCIGCYEQIDGCHIVYGQGNFHFVKQTMRSDPMWHEGLMVTYDTDTAKIGFFPVVATEVGMRLADAEEAKTILDAFYLRNGALQDGTWRDGWHAFCEQSRPWYTKVAANACTEAGGAKSVEFFAHYLDCEAHTDVWRELFPTRNHTNEI